jgi:two-component system, cell cycle sensor histidine kinase and response regulator CckA
LVLNATRRILESADYTILTADNGNDALQVCNDHQGEIHLVLTDVVMPRMNGRELAERMAKIRPEVKILYTSGYTDDIILHHGVLEEGVQFISKPFSSSNLIRKVRELLDRNVP